MKFFLVGVLALQAAQGDPGFGAVAEKRAHGDNGPTVCIDEAHNNHHTADGRYRPFAEMLRQNGYEVVPSDRAFSPATLAPLQCRRDSQCPQPIQSSGICVLEAGNRRDFGMDRVRRVTAVDC